MRTILFVFSFCIFPFNLLFWRWFFPKQQQIPTIRIQHEDVTSGWGETKRALGRQVGKNLGNRVGAVMLIVTAALALSSTVATASDGIIPANGEGLIVAVDVDRNFSTGRNPNNGVDRRVADAEIRLTYRGGITQTVTADGWGVADVQTNDLVSAVVICPPMWDYAGPWVCAESTFFQRDTWTALLVAPRVVWLPVVMTPR